MVYSPLVSEDVGKPSKPSRAHATARSLADVVTITFVGAVAVTTWSDPVHDQDC